MNILFHSVTVRVSRVGTALKRNSTDQHAINASRWFYKVETLSKIFMKFQWTTTLNGYAKCSWGFWLSTNISLSQKRQKIGT